MDGTRRDQAVSAEDDLALVREAIQKLRTDVANNQAAAKLRIDQIAGLRLPLSQEHEEMQEAWERACQQNWPIEQEIETLIKAAAAYMSLQAPLVFLRRETGELEIIPPEDFYAAAKPQPR